MANGSSQDTAFDDFIVGFTIKTVFGPVPLKLALDWPVYISYNDATAFANWAGTQLPTFHEARSIHRQVEEEKAKINNELYDPPVTKDGRTNPPKTKG